MNVIASGRGPARSGRADLAARPGRVGSALTRDAALRVRPALVA